MEEFDLFITNHVSHRIIFLKKIDPDKLYKTEDLCRDFWIDFIGLHKFIGQRIKALSKNETLPIEAIKRTSSNAWLYRLL